MTMYHSFLYVVFLISFAHAACDQYGPRPLKGKPDKFGLGNYEMTCPEGLLFSDETCACSIHQSHKINTPDPLPEAVKTITAFNTDQQVQLPIGNNFKLTNPMDYIQAQKVKYSILNGKKQKGVQLLTQLLKSRPVEISENELQSNFALPRYPDLIAQFWDTSTQSVSKVLSNFAIQQYSDLISSADTAAIKYILENPKNDKSTPNKNDINSKFSIPQYPRLIAALWRPTTTTTTARPKTYRPTTLTSELTTTALPSTLPPNTLTSGQTTALPITLAPTTSSSEQTTTAVPTTLASTTSLNEIITTALPTKLSPTTATATPLSTTSSSTTSTRAMTPSSTTVPSIVVKSFTSILTSTLSPSVTTSQFESSDQPTISGTNPILSLTDQPASGSIIQLTERAYGNNRLNNQSSVVQPTLTPRPGEDKFNNSGGSTFQLFTTLKISQRPIPPITFVNSNLPTTTPKMDIRTTVQPASWNNIIGLIRPSFGDVTETTTTSPTVVNVRPTVNNSNNIPQSNGLVATQTTPSMSNYYSPTLPNPMWWNIPETIGRVASQVTTSRTVVNNRLPINNFNIGTMPRRNNWVASPRISVTTNSPMRFNYPTTAPIPYQFNSITTKIAPNYRNYFPTTENAVNTMRRYLQNLQKQSGSVTIPVTNTNLNKRPITRIGQPPSKFASDNRQVFYNQKANPARLPYYTPRQRQLIRRQQAIDFNSAMAWFLAT